MPFKLNPISGELEIVNSPGAAGGAVDSVTGDSGGAVSPEAGGDLTIIGDATQAYLTTVGTPASNKVEIKLLEPAADGELLIGHTANAEPSVATLTAGSGIIITNGAGTITVGADVASNLSVPTDSGTAASLSSELDILGGTGVSTVGAGNTVTINAAVDVPTSFPTDSGTATPSSNILTVSGGTGINTSGAAATLTVNIDDPVIAATGGTGRQSATAFAVVTGGTTGTGAQQSIASVGTSGQLLTSNGAGALPSMEDAPSAESLPTSLTAGSVVFSDGTNLSQDNANLFWDDTNNRLGIGTSSPVDELHVMGSIDLVHTAANSDDHAFEITCDAAGFGDVKSFEIDYITGALTSVSDDAVILINIDETASLGGEVYGLLVLSTDEGSVTTTAVKCGATVDAIHQDSGTFVDMDSVLNKAVNVTTALSHGGAGNISVFVADDDTITIGDATDFEELEIIVDTGASGSGIAPIFEFSTGVGTWAVFTPVDGTNGFKNTGLIAWDIVDIPSWAIGTGDEFLIRITRTRNSLSTTPILDEIQVSNIIEYSWDKDGLININKVVVRENLTVGHLSDDTSFTINGDAIDVTISVKGSNTTALGGIISHRHSPTAEDGGHIVGLRSRGTHAAPTVVQDDDVISLTASAGFDGTDYALAGQISVEVDGTPGANDMPGRIVLSTSQDGAQTPVEGFRLDRSQVVTLANALPVGSGGTGATTLGDGFVLLGSGTGAVTALDVTTKGSLLVGDGVTDPVALAVGTDAQVLTADSAQSSGVKWATPSAGGGTGLTFLASATASTSSSIDFTSFIDSTYNMYVFVIDVLKASVGGQNIWIRTSADGGSSYDSGSNNYLWCTLEGATRQENFSETFIKFCTYNGTGTNGSFSGLAYLHNPSAAEYTTVTGMGSHMNASGLMSNLQCASRRKASSATDAIRFLPSSGTFVSGTIKLYGMTTPS